MPRRGAWVIGGIAAAAALGVLAVGGSDPAGRSGLPPAATGAFPLCPAAGRTKPITAADRSVAQAVAVAYIAAVHSANVRDAIGLVDAGSVQATHQLIGQGLFVPPTATPSAGPVAPLAHDPLGRAIAVRCGASTLAATLSVRVNLLPGSRSLRVLLVRRPDRFLVFYVR
jgi:hypothetical protein